MGISRANRLALTCMLAVAFGMVACVDAWSAQAAPKLELKMSQAKEVTTIKDGKKVVTRVPVDKTDSGDVVVYTITYTNTGTGDARDAAIVDPIPEAATYIVGSAEGKGAAITFSIDGGKNFGKEPLKRTVKKADGTTEEKDAEPGMYTHVRWVVDKVPAGKSGKASFKVTIK